MKAVSGQIPDFIAIEKKILKYWQKNKILDKYLQRNKNSKKYFSFLDGPITANNPMGVHHAWGRTYKDLWQRFYNMRGFKQRFQNGFDEQGLWVEVEVEKELGLKTKKDIENLIPGSVYESITKFVSLCKARVKKYSQIQAEQSKRLGYFMDWENSYHTSSDQNNYAIWHYLKDVHQKSWLYKGRDSVPWCPRCGTAISQHEILTEEYKVITHESVYFKLPIIDRGNEFLLVWTTTPWTIPANVAVAINPKEQYTSYKDTESNEIYWIMDKREQYLSKQKILKTLNKKETIIGAELIGWEYEGPFDSFAYIQKTLGNYKHRIIDGTDIVTEFEGTGLLHVAPGAGEEDFKLGQKFGLPIIALIEEDASYIKEMQEFSGMNAKQDPNIIITALKEKAGGTFFLKTQSYTHRYPTCWRCKTELVWRVVDEWYIAMDRKDPKVGKTYREMMKDVISDINWIPKWGYDRELDWFKNMHDWLVSKKRYWGLALPIWECHKCHNFEVIGSKEELREKAVEGWEKFEGNSPHRPWIDQIKIKCTKCGEILSRIPDVGNPWLDAGIVPYSTLKYFEDKKYWQKWFPVDFITESFPGQFKNWFYSLIAMSVALENTAPFKTLLGHGQVRDEKGEEMHKSKGNAIEFNQAADQIGVDVMRWLYLRTNPEHNVNFGFHVTEEIKRLFHFRLWNIYSFFVNNSLLDNWKPKKTKPNPKHVLDKWILSRLYGNVRDINEALDGLNTQKYISYKAIGLAEIFIIRDLSNWYVRRIKNRIGPNVKNSADKDQAYQTLYYVLINYLKILAPMIPFLTEEMYTNITQEQSIHLTDWPKINHKFYNRKLEVDMEIAINLASEAHSERKQKGIKLRQPLSKLEYNSNPKLASSIEQILAEETNVKNVFFNPKLDVDVRLNTKIDNKLKTEGEARDIVRLIQQKRKENGLTLKDKVIITAPYWPEEFTDFIKQQTAAVKISKGKELKLKKLEDGQII